MSSHVVLHQDNRSMIMLAKAGRSGNYRSKHIKLRYFHIQEKIDEGIVVVRHTGTKLMLADGLTKVLVGEQFRRMTDAILNDGWKGVK